MQKILQTKSVLISILTLCFLIIGHNQKGYTQNTFNITGKVKDKSTRMPLVGANVVLKKPFSSDIITGTTTDTNGYFLIKALPGKYKIEVSYIGYKTDTLIIQIKDSDVHLRAILLSEISTEIKGTEIKETQTRVEIKGDTIEIKSDAYKVGPDATAEDLIKKMPGITAEGNTIKVHGEEVKKVIVDGRPFFGDDPTTTLRNLPAEIIDNIQIFDQWSDQAQFTGFRDGNEEKTINLRTKKGQNVGTFGKIYAGYGIDERYNAGLTVNYFNGPQRISLIGMTNNINQQNFNIADIMSVISTSGQSLPRSGTGFFRGGGSGAANFFMPQQAGITKTNAFGLNYIDNWGTKIRVSGNYFFNITENSNKSQTTRQYFSREKLIYNQENDSKNKNLNHRFNFKFEYVIDSANKLTITPKLTYQNNNANSFIIGHNQINNYQILSKTKTYNSTKGEAYNFSNEILLQHKFNKPRRTISLSLNTQLNNQDNNGKYYNSTEYNDSTIFYDSSDQLYKANVNSTTIGGNLSYTEPLGKNGQLLISYKPNITSNKATKNTYEMDQTYEYTIIDSILSNKYENYYNIQRGGLNYRLSINKVNFSIGSDIQQTLLSGNQLFPTEFTTEKSFFSILPSSSLSIRFDKNVNLSVNYQTSTRAPSISQLQNTADISNPLFVRIGNPQLKETYEHNLRVRFSRRIQENERHYFVFLNVNHTNRYITNSSILYRNDTILNGLLIKKGTQIIMPINLDNYFNIRSFITYGMPLSFIKSNLNINVGYNFIHNPAMLNNKIIYSNSNLINYGTHLSSNISKNIDFSLSYNGSYNFINQITKRPNSQYLTNSILFKITYTFLERFVVNSEASYYKYSGLSEGYNTEYILLNSYLAYKFLKNKSLELRFSITDILNQNKNITRNITETYTEDVSTISLGRYALLTITYNFKKFKQGSIGPEEIKPPRHFPPPPGGSFPPPPPRD